MSGKLAEASFCGSKSRRSRHYPLRMLSSRLPHAKGAQILRSSTIRHFARRLGLISVCIYMYIQMYT